MFLNFDDFRHNIIKSSFLILRDGAVDSVADEEGVGLGDTGELRAEHQSKGGSVDTRYHVRPLVVANLRQCLQGRKSTEVKNESKTGSSAPQGDVEREFY